MKTVSGKLVSVQPISLAKAARYISDFASFENNGASEVLSIYLNRASEAFGLLVQLHKDLKHPQSSDKKHRKKKNSRNEDDTSLRNVEAVNYDDGEKKSRSRDEKQGEMEGKRGRGVSNEDASVRVGEDMGESKKKRKEKTHKKGSVEVEDSISSELRKGGENGGSVEIDNVVNGLADHSKKKKNKEKKKDVNNQEGLKMEGSVDGESRGENSSDLGMIKRERKDKEKNVKKVEENLEVGQETESKKKRKSVDLDGELKENSGEPTRKKRKK